MAGRDSAGTHLMTCEQRKRTPGLRSSLALLQSRRLTQVAAAMRMRRWLRALVALAPAGRGGGRVGCCNLRSCCSWAPAVLWVHAVFGHHLTPLAAVAEQPDGQLPSKGCL